MLLQLGIIRLTTQQQMLDSQQFKYLYSRFQKVINTISIANSLHQHIYSVINYKKNGCKSLMKQRRKSQNASKRRDCIYKPLKFVFINAVDFETS